MPSDLPAEIAALDLQPRASEPLPLAWTLAEAVAASPILVLATVLDPRTETTLVAIARGNALADPAHAYARIRQRFQVSTALRGALAGEVLVDAALWRRDLERHRRRVLQGQDRPLSVPRVLGGNLASSLPGETVLLLLRQTPAGLEFAGQNAVLHVELLPVVQALLMAR